MEILFIVLFAYLRRIKPEQLQKAADVATSKAKKILSLEKSDQAVSTLALIK